MALNHRNRIWGIVAVLMIAGILFRGPISNAIFAARFASSIPRLALASSQINPDVLEAKIRRQSNGRTLEALMYRPAKYPAAMGLVLVAGISEQGCYHPGIIALSRYLANRGFLVVTPDIREFRELQITAEPIDQIEFWFKQIPAMKGSERVRKRGIAGISFSGTLALIAATRPDIRDQVGFVLGIGSYYNLIRCSRDWFAPVPGTEKTNPYPTKFYAKWVVMLPALDMLPAPGDRTFLHELLTALILQKKVPQAPADLTPEGQRWYALATMPATESDPGLAREIEEFLQSRIYPQIDPRNCLDQLRCPAFFVHGAYDDMIPPAESEELHRRIANSYLLITPFLTHTYATTAPLSLKQKAFAVLNASIFCYHLACAIR